MLEGKTVLVTGSTRGIGKATALAFAREGANVILNSRSTGKEADAALREIRKAASGKVEFIAADVSSEKDVLRMRDDVKKRFGKLDVLVNNAGILRKESPAKPNWSYWDAVFATNLKGLAMCSYAFSEIMPVRSSIVNVASVWGLELPAYDANAYAASKAGVVNLTKTLAAQLAPKIRVNAVAPSVVATEMLHENDPQTKKWLESSVPLGRAAKPEEVAELIVFLASEKAAFITGETVKIDGGLTLKI